MEEAKIVLNASQGNKYTYASLSDIAKQGYAIPQMAVKKVDGDEYVFYADGDIWVQGARVVIPSAILNSAGKPTMNEAQLYGSALTYARRYTVLLALGLACDDDKQLESEPPKASKKQVNYLQKLYSAESVVKICEYYGVDDLSDLNVAQAKEAIDNAIKRNNEKPNK